MTSFLWKQSNLCVCHVFLILWIYMNSHFMQTILLKQKQEKCDIFLQRSIGNNLVFECTKHRTKFLLKLQDQVKQNSLV